MTSRKPTAPKSSLLKSDKKADAPLGPNTGKPLSGAAAAAVNGKPGPGRPKGCLNKVSREVADMVKDALECSILEAKGASPAKLLAKYDGGTAYLIQRSKQQPNAFLSLVAKLMPQQIKADVNVNTDLASRLAEAEARAKKSK